MDNWERSLVDTLEKKNQEVTEQFIIGSVTKKTGELSIAQRPKMHGNAYLAGQEANRLAQMYHNKKFVVLQVVSVHTVNDVDVTDRL